MNTKKRIIQYLNHKEITKTAFFTYTGIKRGFLDADKLSGAVTDEHFAKILANYSDLDLSWLITGEGDMIKTNDSQPSEPTIIYKSDPKDLEIIQLLRDKVRLLEEKTKETDAHFQNARFGDPATVAEPPQPSKRAKSKS